MRENELSHYGILGQKWGIRRFQNPDGSYTAEGKKRYSSGNFGGVYDKEDGTKDYKRMKADAKKDASDMAKANAAYGEGSGTRRKLVKNR